MRGSAEIRREIEEKLGFVPSFFEPAFGDPPLLASLWQQTLGAYLDNPIPARFKELLFADLSRFCTVPYCLVSHSCSLRPLGVGASEILQLLERPAEPTSEPAALAAKLGALPALTTWPEPGDPAWDALYESARHLFLGSATRELRIEVRRVAAGYWSGLAGFLAYIKTCHAWVELHPEVSFENDRRAVEHLAPLVQEEPRLQDIFEMYQERVSAERRQRELSRADSASRRLTLLAGLSAVSSGLSSDETEALVQIAEAAVPAMADWCVVDLVDGAGQFQRVAAAAANADHRRLLDELRRRYPPSWSSPQPAARVLRTRAPELIPSVDPSIVAEHTYDDDHRAILSQLGLRSHLAVPIIDEQHVIGALSFALTGEQRRYTTEDVHIAQEFASRAASVITAARHRREIAALEERLRLALDAAAVGTWDYAPVSEVLEWDERCRAVFGLSQDAEVRYDIFLDLVHPDDRERVDAAVKRALDPSGEGRYAMEYRAIGGDGVERWVQARGRAFFQDGRAVRLVGAVVDITDRQRVEEESRVREILARLAMSFATELDEEKLLQLITDEATELTGAAFGSFFFNADTNRGDGYRLYVVSGASREAFVNFPMPRATPIFAPTFRGEQIVRLDDVTRDPRFGAWGRQPPGHPEVRSYLAVPVVTRAGDVIGGLFFGHPEPARFTERHAKLVEGISAHAAVALENARLYGDLRESQRRAQEADRRKDEFLAVLGHELRNPLAPMLTALELISLKKPAGIDRERDVLGRQVRHLARLVDDLLDVSRITRGKIQLTRQTLDVATVAAEAIDMTSPLLEERRHELTVDVPPRTLWVEGDRVRLAQVVSNLLTNAAKYTDPAGSIGISGCREGNDVVLRVHDNGIGISAEALPRLFDPFVQDARGVDQARGGLGLGLTLAKSLVEAHEGRVEVHSDGAGHGSEFVVRLPASRAHAPGVAAPPEPRPPSVAPARVKVLIVDDNPDAAAVLAQALESIGHDVKIAADGPRALALAGEFAPEVAVLDIGLPVMDGYELARRLRASSTSPIRLLALTGYGQEADRDKARDAGFEEHFVKPVALDVLVAAIAKCAPPRAPNTR